MNFIYEKERHGKLHCYIHDTVDVAAHIHDSIEIIYIIEGSASAFCDGKEYVLNSGDAFVVFPQKIHYYCDLTDMKVIISIIPIEYLPEFRSAFLNKTLSSPHIIGASDFVGELLRKAATADNIHHKAFRRGAILAAFSLLLDKSELVDKKSDTTTLQKILDYCENHYKENIYLEDISKELFISKSYISHIFSEKIGMGFRDYINSLRVSLSLNYLKDGNLPITEVSAVCGFESIRSFNRAFKKIHATTPSEYRKNLHNLM